MVLRNTEEKQDFNIKFENRWIHVNEELLRWHPGASAMLAFKNLDATTVFHSFHANSKFAYKKLGELLASQPNKSENDLVFASSTLSDEKSVLADENVNMGSFELAEHRSEKVMKNFDVFRKRVKDLGLLDANHSFFFRKIFELLALIALALSLQYHELFCSSALIMGLAWQQSGWLIHEYTHHQHFKTRFFNDLMSYMVGNLIQGFSSGGWKEQHNRHHAFPNIDGRDGDLDLLPLWVTVGSQLKLIDQHSIYLHLIQFQHIYWLIALPFLRLSWLIQSILFVASMQNHFYEIHRKRALVEQITLFMHWSLVLVQYYFLPDFKTRFNYFLISQLFGGFLIAHVVTYNHYSCPKFPFHHRIIENYVCLQLYTTRNMAPGHLIDWLWGGLNYQIEHHLFPTMPRHNLKKVMPLVKEFCNENELPYMVDDYCTGLRLTLAQLHDIAKLASMRVLKRMSLGVGKN